MSGVFHCNVCLLCCCFGIFSDRCYNDFLNFTFSTGGRVDSFIPLKHLTLKLFNFIFGTLQYNTICFFLIIYIFSWSLWVSFTLYITLILIFSVMFHVFVFICFSKSYSLYRAVLPDHSLC